jgi:hypothetical protein
MVNDRSLQRLASTRVAKLTQLVLPPSHESVLDVMGLIWVDGLETGLQLTGERHAGGRPRSLPEAVYADLESAELCSQYEEFPELDDPDFQNLAYGRVQKFGRQLQPAGHPESSGYTVEIWMDGVAAGLRIVKQEAAGHRPVPVE